MVLLQESMRMIVNAGSWNGLYTRQQLLGVSGFTTQQFDEMVLCMEIKSFIHASISSSKSRASLLSLIMNLARDLSDPTFRE